MRLVSLLFLVFLLSPLAYATEKTMPILATRADGNGNATGSIAHLHISTEFGQDRVFIETIPITKADTQMSTRLAKKIACNLLEKDCGNIDFFYTIRADSSIIGGPSASAAIAIITVAALENLDIREKTSITGTINSGNIIGPVGGLVEKIEAASKNSIDTVIIPKGESIVKQDNLTINLYELGDMNGVTIIEAATLEDALFIFTGKNYSKNGKRLTIAPSYTHTMMNLSLMLCDRTKNLSYRLIDRAKENNLGNWSQKEQTLNLTDNSMEAFDNLQFYSAASYCFGANVRIMARLLEIQNFTEEEFTAKINELERQAQQMEKSTEDRDISTITDLQTYMVVKERIADTKETIDRLKKRGNNSFPYGDLAYANERLVSAVSWSRFFGTPGQSYNLNTEALLESCAQKLSEADETYQYVTLFFPGEFTAIRELYNDAFSDYQQKDYALCLFKASKAKAQANVMMSTLGIQGDKVLDAIALKLDVAEKLISEQADKGRFPIVGYSYFEYADSLMSTDQYSGFLYAEYALELSNLDLYFGTTKEKFLPPVDRVMMLIFVLGLLIGAAGMASMQLIGQIHKRRKSRK